MVLYFSVGGKGVILCDPEMETEVGEISETLKYYHNFKATLLSLLPDKNILVYFEEPIYYLILPDPERLTEEARENIRKYLSRIEEAEKCGMVKIYIDKELSYSSQGVEINNPKEIKVEELKRIIF